MLGVYLKGGMGRTSRGVLPPGVWTWLTNRMPAPQPSTCCYSATLLPNHATHAHATAQLLFASCLPVPLLQYDQGAAFPAGFNKSQLLQEYNAALVTLKEQGKGEEWKGGVAGWRRCRGEGGRSGHVRGRRRVRAFKTACCCLLCSLLRRSGACHHLPRPACPPGVAALPRSLVFTWPRLIPPIGGAALPRSLVSICLTPGLSLGAATVPC